MAPYVNEAALLCKVLAALGPEESTLTGARGADSDHVPARKARILTIVGDHPGITVADIADRYGMKRSVVASSVSRLKRCGEIVHRNGGLRLTRREPGGSGNDM